MILCNQISMPQPLAKEIPCDQGHLVCGVMFTNVVGTGKFVDGARKVLGTHLVTGAAIATLEQGPKGLTAVRVGVTIHVFSSTEWVTDSST